MKWTTCTIGDCLDVKHGYAFEGQYFSDKGSYVVLTPGNFFEEGGFRFRPEKERFYSIEPPSEYILLKDAIIVAMTEQAKGLLGSSVSVPIDNFFLHNQRLGLLAFDRSKDTCDKYFYYLFNTKSVRDQIQATASGTKVRHTSPSRIKAVKIFLPSFQEQVKIVEILSAYDSLIENNKRRIELLEESARLLYKEWFVNLRFPGHEHVKKVDGVPEGWEVVCLKDIVTLNYGKALKEEARTSGDYPVYGSSGIVGTHNKPLINGKGIIVGRKGNVGSVFFSAIPFWPIDTVYYLDSDQSSLWNYFTLRKIPFQNSDGAVPGLNRERAYSIEIVNPTEKLKKQYEGYVSHIFQQILTLQKYIDSLTKARDLLLPKLISGEMTL